MQQGKWNTEVYEWANPVNYGVTSGMKQIYDSYLHGANGSTMHGKLIRTDTYKKAIELVGEDIINAHIFYNEDMLMMGAIYLCTKTYVGLNKTGYSYYYHSTNSMTQSRNSLELALRRQKHTIMAYKRILELYPQQTHAAIQRNFVQSIAYQIVVTSKFMSSKDNVILCDNYLKAGIMTPEQTEFIDQKYCQPARNGTPYKLGSDWEKREKEREKMWKQVEAQEEMTKLKRAKGEL